MTPKGSIVSIMVDAEMWWGMNGRLGFTMERAGVDGEVRIIAELREVSATPADASFH